MLVNHRLLSVSPGVPRYPLGIWRAHVEPVARSQPSCDGLEQWCVANNNLALIHFHLNDADAAHHVCTQQIQTLLRRLEDNNSGGIAQLLILQPLVNLARLAGRDAGGETIDEPLRSLRNFIFQTETAERSTLFEAIVPDPIMLRSHRGEQFLQGVIALCQSKIALRGNDIKGLEDSLHNLGLGIAKEVRYILQLHGRTLADKDIGLPHVFQIYHLRQQGRLDDSLSNLMRDAFRVLVQQAEASLQHGLARAAVEFYRALTQEEASGSLASVEKLYRTVTRIGDEFDQYDLLAGLSSIDPKWRKDWRRLAEITGYPALKMRAREEFSGRAQDQRL